MTKLPTLAALLFISCGGDSSLEPSEIPKGALPLDVAGLYILDAVNDSAVLVNGVVAVARTFATQPCSSRSVGSGTDSLQIGAAGALELARDGSWRIWYARRSRCYINGELWFGGDSRVEFAGAYRQVGFDSIAVSTCSSVHETCARGGKAESSGVVTLWLDVEPFGVQRLRYATGNPWWCLNLSNCPYF